LLPEKGKSMLELLRFDFYIDGIFSIFTWSKLLFLKYFKGNTI